MELLSRRAKITVKVKRTEDWLGADEVYVLAKSTRRLFQTPTLDLNDGESHPFWIPLRKLCTRNSLGAPIEIKVYDEDVGFFFDSDDLIVWMRWPRPFVELHNKRSRDQADYDVAAEL